MKFFIVIALVLLVAWLWRSGRRDLPGGTREQADPPAAPPGPQAMVRCGHCGVHLPRHEAVVGRIGIYCSAEHQQLAEP